MMSSIAKEIGSRISKASRKFRCPTPISASCGRDSCDLRLEESAQIPADCNWNYLVGDLSREVSKERAKMAQRFGCDASLVANCAPGAAGWWGCGEAHQSLLRRGSRGSDAPPHGKG